MEELKRRLNKALTIRNISQVELSKSTGIPKSSISQYLSGYSKPKSDRIYLIANALNISEAWLIGYDVPMDGNEDTPEPSADLPRPVIVECSKDISAKNMNAQLTSDEKDIVCKYRKMDDLDKGRISERMDVMLESEKYEDKKERLQA